LVKLLTSENGTTAELTKKEGEFTHPSIAKLSITRALFLWENLYMHIY